MEQAQHIEAPKAPKVRKARRKRRVRSAAPKAADPFRGLTTTVCALDCNAECCVISGKGYCAHPRKGGLQGQEMANPAAIERAARAKKKLAHLAVDKRT